MPPFRTWAEYSAVGAIYLALMALIEWVSGADVPLGLAALACAVMSLAWLACARRWPGNE